MSTEEHYLALPGGRTLAYTHAGTPSSKTVAIYLHGSFSIGNVSHPPKLMLSTDKPVHYICPTLPGWGRTSAPLEGVEYADCVTGDMSALLEYFYPSDAGEEERGEVKLYIAGASFGSLPAQILYGAPYTKFPFGRSIKGMMPLVPVPSFRHFPEYHKHLNWLWWVFAGPVVKWDWLGVVPKLMAWMMGTQFKSVERAEGALRTSVVDAMDSQEREVYEVWCRENGITQAQAEREMAEMAVRSVATTWSGIRMLPSIGHADWGFHPDELDEEHTRPPVLVVRAKADNMAPEVFQRWLVEHYRGARMRKIEGGHMAPRYYMDELWGEIMDGA